MVSIKEFTFVLILASIGSTKADIIRDISAKRVNLPPLKILLYLTRVSVLSQKGKVVISEYLEETLGVTNEQVEELGAFIKIALPLMNDLRGQEIFSNVKPDGLYNAAVVFIAYDMFDQILNEDHTDSFLTIPIGVDKPKSEVQKKVLRGLSEFFSSRVKLPENDLDRFYEGTEEEVKQRKEEVQKLKEVTTSQLQDLISADS